MRAGSEPSAADARRRRAGAAADLDRFLASSRAEIDAILPSLLPPASGPKDRVREAMAHALLAPGKRIRSILTLAVVDVYGARPQGTLQAACATELVHTASLILDDLPCMDGASTRRGRPATHVAFGEATAILAAVALLNHAYGVVAGDVPGMKMKEKLKCALARLLSGAIGTHGVIGGQQADLLAEGAALTLRDLEFVHSHKTGSLFIASAEIGGLLAGASVSEMKALRGYAKNLGLAFQITDDILDAAGTAEATGKPSGMDARRTTFVDLCGVEGSRELASELVESAVAHLEGFGARARLLADLARLIASRER